MKSAKKKECIWCCSSFVATTLLKVTNRCSSYFFLVILWTLFKCFVREAKCWPFFLHPSTLQISGCRYFIHFFFLASLKYTAGEHSGRALCWDLFKLWADFRWRSIRFVSFPYWRQSSIRQQSSTGRMFICMKWTKCVLNLF